MGDFLRIFIAETFEVYGPFAIIFLVGMLTVILIFAVLLIPSVILGVYKAVRAIKKAKSEKKRVAKWYQDHPQYVAIEVKAQKFVDFMVPLLTVYAVNGEKPIRGQFQYGALLPLGEVTLQVGTHYLDPERHERRYGRGRHSGPNDFHLDDYIYHLKRGYKEMFGKIDPDAEEKKLLTRGVPIELFVKEGYRYTVMKSDDGSELLVMVIDKQDKCEWLKFSADPGFGNTSEAEKPRRAHKHRTKKV